MKVITLTLDQITVVDNQDYKYLVKSKCWACYDPKKNGYYGYTNVDGKRKSIHRVILERKLGRPLDYKKMCDHRNGNTLDNRRTNLREADRSLNSFNSKIHKSNILGVRGIRFKNNKYVPRIKYKGKAYYLGTYNTLDEAIIARKTAEQMLYGETLCNKS